MKELANTVYKSKCLLNSELEYNKYMGINRKIEFLTEGEG